MACQAKIDLYSDLKGNLTGEFDIECVGDCAGGGDCAKKVQRWSNELRISCACPGGPEGECNLTLIATRGTDGVVRMRRKCNNRLCGDGTACRKCRVVSYGKWLTVLDLEGKNPRVRQVEQFRCDCVPFEHAPRFKEVLERDLCPLIAAALADGSTLSRDDFFHCHWITDQFPDSDDVDAADSPVVGDGWLLDHYRGLLGHLHEYDGKRETGAHANIWIEKKGTPTFLDGSTPLNPVDLVPPGASPDSIYFRFCEARKECPPCTVKIRCAGKDICVGFRSDWPEGDPALGR